MVALSLAIIVVLPAVMIKDIQEAIIVIIATSFT
jgi:hypothetical protein